MTCRGHIHNGTIVLESPTDLPEGTKVEVEVRPVSDQMTEREAELQKLAEGINYDFDAFWRLREMSKL